MELRDLLAEVLVFLEESKRAVRQDALALTKLAQASDTVRAEDRECAEGSHNARKAEKNSDVRVYFLHVERSVPQPLGSPGAAS